MPALSEDGGGDRVGSAPEAAPGDQGGVDGQGTTGRRSLTRAEWRLRTGVVSAVRRRTVAR